MTSSKGAALAGCAASLCRSTMRPLILRGSIRSNAGPVSSPNRPSEEAPSKASRNSSPRSIALLRTTTNSSAPSHALAGFIHDSDNTLCLNGEPQWAVTPTGRPGLNRYSLLGVYACSLPIPGILLDLRYAFIYTRSIFCLYLNISRYYFTVDFYISFIYPFAQL